MNLGVKLYPSKTNSNDDPGHMCVSWELQKQEWRGFYFRPMDLPKEFRNASKWRDYLFGNRVPGFVVRDARVKLLYQRRPEAFSGRDWEVSNDQEDAIIAAGKPGRHGYYSFNPDTHDCDNCVTWAVSFMNTFVPNALPRVRQGRIKEMHQHLKSMP